MDSDRRPGIRITLLLIVGLLTFGIAPIMVRFATDVHPMTLAALRTLFAVLLLIPFWLPRRRTLGELRADGVNIMAMSLAGVCLGVHFSFWTASLYYTSVASASVLVTIHPVMVIVAERLLFKRQFRPIVWMGVVMSSIGSVVLGFADQATGGDFVNPAFGNALAFTAAVIFVIYFLISRSVRQRAQWIDYAFHVYLWAAVICALMTLIWSGGLPYLTQTGLLVGLALAIGPTIIGHGSMNYAVKYISPTILSTLILAEAVIAALAAWLIFNELPSPVSLAAMLVIVTGVGLSWVQKRGAV